MSYIFHAGNASPYPSPVLGQSWAVWWAWLAGATTMCLTAGTQHLGEHYLGQNEHLQRCVSLLGPSIQVSII